MRVIIPVFIFFLTTVFLFSGCANKELDRLTEQVSQLGRQNQDLRRQLNEARASAEVLSQLSGYLEGVKARIHTNHGTIEVEFFYDLAPVHVFNFVARAESGFYDNTQFHRVIPGFMIQGGDPNSRDDNKLNNGQGGPLTMIPHEFNSTRHERGILSMARVSDKSAGAGSQFFIMHADRFHLDNEYTAFGRVTSGMDVVDRIAEVEKHTDEPRLRDHPVNPVVIRTIEVYK